MRDIFREVSKGVLEAVTLKILEHLIKNKKSNVDRSLYKEIRKKLREE